MKISTLNPWNWLYNAGHWQAMEGKNREGALCCAAQASIDANGKPVGGNMKEQIRLSLENLRNVIKKAGYHPANIVRMNFYTTSISSFFEAYNEAVVWLRKYDVSPTTTLIQVETLAYPELSVEIEATLLN